jgi:peptide/nickel transport system permease protein
MTRAILVHVAHSLISVLALLFLVFVLIRLAGDPINFLVDPDASQQQRDFARHELGLDQPIPVQFVVYVSHVATGDLGLSWASRIPVMTLVMQRLPNTLILGASALIFTVVVGVPLGVYSAYWRNSKFDKVVRLFAGIGQSTPSFWLGLLLILFFAVRIPLLPSGGGPGGGFQYLILPTICLSVENIAGLTRLLRSSMVEVLSSDFVLFHRIKGLPERRLVWRHALRNAGLSSLSFVGILSARLFSGAVLVETVFVWPGMGRLMIESIGKRDLNVVQGVLLLLAFGYIVVNLIVDILAVVLNPRLR